MLLLSVMEHFSYGQCLINGIVTDEKGNPLTGVNVLIKGTYDGAATNITGEFYFQSNEQGVQIMIVSYLGYKILEREVTLDGDLKDMQFILKEEINKIEGITISAGAFEASDKKKSVVLRTFDIVTTAGATADITGVMNTLPGTQTVGEAGRLFVRGGDGYETKTFINGLLVAVPYGQTPHNIPSRFRFNPFLFKGAFFSTGGYSAEYGQALSSVLQLDTYDLPAKSQTDVSTMSVGGDISQTIRKGNTSIYGQIQYTDLSGYFFLVPQKYAWDRAPNSYNSTLHFKQRFNETGTIQLYTNYDHSGMKVYQPLPGNVNEQGLFDISNDNFYSNFAIKNSLSEHLSYRGGLSFSANNSQVIMNGEISNESRIQANHSKIVFDHDVSENILLRYGGEWIYSDYTEIFIDQGENLVQEFNVRDHTVGSFAEADVYFSNKLMARVGARYEFNSSIDKQCVSPRTSLAYKLDKHSQFSMAFGRFTQLPTIDYMKWSTNLKPEKATHYILNYQYNNTGRIFRSEIYYKKYDQLVTKKYNSEQLVDLGNGGYGSAEGFELFWRDSKTFDHTDYLVDLRFYLLR